MCVNYVPVTAAGRMLKTFGVVRTDRPPSEIFTGGLAPFIRLAPDGTDSGELALAVDDGIFRFVPEFMTKADWARHTQNVRAETVETRVTYRESWADGHRCIIPAEWIFEPNYEADEHVRWRIRRADGNPMGIAGMYRVLPFPDREGRQQFAFSMLTVNADGHAFTPCIVGGHALTVGLRLEELPGIMPHWATNAL